MDVLARGRSKTRTSFSTFRGHVLVDPDQDLMVFLYPYRQGQVPPSVYDEFVKQRDALPRWTRARWPGQESGPAASGAAS